MHPLELTFVGTGNAFAPGGLCWNGFVANRRVLFEAPPTALMALHKVGIDPNDIDAVVVSHHHGDHFLGLPSLLLHWKYMGRTRPLTIVGPIGTEVLTRKIGEAVYPGLMEIQFDIQWVVATAGRTLQLPGLTVEPVAVEHDHRLSASLGFACEAGGRRFAYTGDSRLCEAVYDLARSSEVLVSECASLNDSIPIHMNLVDDIPQVRAAMAPEAILLLTHLGPHIEAAELAHTTVARDFKTYRF
jgi:ribonuclease BN (tRNA processing enzyme)